jgi:alginate biosynthesis protein AlgX
MIRVVLLLFFLNFAFISNVEANDRCISQIQTAETGWLFRSKTDFMREFEINSELEEKFRRLNEALEDQGMKLIIALLPTRGMMADQQIENFNSVQAQKSYLEVASVFETVGIRVAYIKDFKNEDFYYKTDHHWSDFGAKMMAKTVSDIITVNPAYKDLPKTEYQEEVRENQKFKGSFSKILEKDCGVAIDEEVYSDYTIYPAKNSLIDLNNADIVLIGTSNSDKRASKANFEGHLKKELSADVVNHSISGGGHDSALLQYLVSKDFQGNKPKFIIWEFPIYQDFRNPDFYKQAIASIYGSCGGNALFQEKVNINNNKFKVTLDQGINVEKAYLHINLPEFNKKKFRVTLVEEDNKRTPFNFERSKFYKPDGQFYLDLSYVKNIKSIEGLLPESYIETAEVSICSYSE